MSASNSDLINYTRMCAGSGNLSAAGSRRADSLRLDEKGLTVDRTHVTPAGESRGAPRRDRYESGDSFDEYLSDGDHSRRSFLIVQPQLKQEDVSRTSFRTNVFPTNRKSTVSYLGTRMS